MQTWCMQMILYEKLMCEKKSYESLDSNWYDLTNKGGKWRGKDTLPEVIWLGECKFWFITTT